MLLRMVSPSDPGQSREDINIGFADSCIESQNSEDYTEKSYERRTGLMNALCRIRLSPLSVAALVCLSVVSLATAAQDRPSRPSPSLASASGGSGGVAFGGGHAGSVTDRRAERPRVSAPYVFLYGADSALMSGSSDDARRALELRGGSEEDFLWFRHGEADYVLRDPGALAAAREIFAPVLEVTRQGDALGARLAQLGQAEPDPEGADDESLERSATQREDLINQYEALDRRRQQIARKAESKLGLLLEEAVRSGAAQRPD
jgi:hypothetical protein